MSPQAAPTIRPRLSEEDQYDDAGDANDGREAEKKCLGSIKERGRVLESFHGSRPFCLAAQPEAARLRC
jgi:hypothetical protein